MGACCSLRGSWGVKPRQGDVVATKRGCRQARLHGSARCCWCRRRSQHRGTPGGVSAPVPCPYGHRRPWRSRRRPHSASLSTAAASSPRHHTSSSMASLARRWHGDALAFSRSDPSSPFLFSSSSRTALQRSSGWSSWRRRPSSSAPGAPAGTPPPPASCAPFLLLHLPPVSSGDRFGWGAPLAAAV